MNIERTVLMRSTYVPIWKKSVCMRGQAVVRAGPESQPGLLTLRV